MSASWASPSFKQEKFVDVLKKQALVCTARNAFSRARSYWESSAAQSISDAVHI